MRTTCTLFSVLAILWALAVSPAAAKDDPLEFLHLLQKEGYADVAVDYLDQLKADPNAPKEIMDLWDLEMSRSKKEAVRQRRLQRCPGQTMDRGVQGPARAVHQGQSPTAGSDPGGGPASRKSRPWRPNTTC